MIPVVAGSNPVSHPNFNNCFKYELTFSNYGRIIVYMKLRINRNKRWWSKKDQSNIAAAVRYCVTRYGMEDLTLSVKLGKENTLYDGLSDTKDDGGYKVWIYPNKHELQTVFHEMTHIKQFYYGELDMLGSVPKWMGKKCGKSYAKCPWEKEANKMEEVLLKEFLDIQLNS